MIVREFEIDVYTLLSLKWITRWVSTRDMGKVRGLQAWVHQAAVRPTEEATPGPGPPTQEAFPLQASAGGVGGTEWVFMNANVFAGTTKDPSALVQKLGMDARGTTSIRRGAKATAVLPKKEKLKLRRERWLWRDAVSIPGLGTNPICSGATKPTHCKY